MVESRRHRGPRDTKRSDWHVGRAGSITSAFGFKARSAAGCSLLRYSRQGSLPEGARRRAFDGGSTRSATARPGASGRRPL